MYCFIVSLSAKREILGWLLFVGLFSDSQNKRQVSLKYVDFSANTVLLSDPEILNGRKKPTFILPLWCSPKLCGFFVCLLSYKSKV